MKKFFDYKFLLLLCLSLIVYFLHREIEFMNKRLHKIEKNFNNLLDYKPNHNILDEVDNIEKLNTTYDIQLPLPSSNLVEPINYNNVEQNKLDNQCYVEEVFDNEVVKSVENNQSEYSEELLDVKSSELDINLDDIETMSDNNLDDTHHKFNNYLG